MRKRCGWFAPLVLNFDFTFLALLLAADEKKVHTECRRCHVPPFKKRCMCAESGGLELAADESVILAYWKMRDQIDDSGFFAGLAVRIFCLLFRGAYRAARNHCIAFDASVRTQLSQLRRLEKERCPSIDQTADTFAKLLCAAVPVSGCTQIDRAREQMLYHLGRWIYLVDARDDLQEDRKTGNYNPISLRFPQGGADETLAVTLDHSIHMMQTASVLLDFGVYEPLVSNILDHGLPAIQQLVFRGQWSKMKKQRIWRKYHERSL